MSEHSQSGFEIAIIGMAGRFPGAANLDKFWQNLSDGIETIRFLTTEELCALGRDKESLNKENFVPAHGVSDGYDLFDADFFGFSPREAEMMDPQQRVLLEIAHEALETAAYNPKSYDGSIGVFAGVSASNYLYTNVYKNLPRLSSVDVFQVNSMNQSDFLTTRISYKLNLTGPSFTVLSACSSSLVAIHLACQQLISGACDIALAGGISLTLPQHWGYHYEEGMVASPDGHCRAFDEGANGCLKGDGGGIVVLKCAADAIKDGDHIDAIILGSAINNDGAYKVGYAAPSLEGQIEVIRSAQIMAGIKPDSISYIEAHGTGTSVGDPIEISALTQAFRKQTQRKQFCAVGSVKTNIGHLDPAAGIAGLIKTVLAIKNKTIPPSLHFKKPNPQIDFKESPFYINDKCKPWKTVGHPLRAGVSSFGIGGTNAHVILEEAPLYSHDQTKEVNSDQLILLSARSEQALNTMTDNLANYLKKHPSLNLEDVAYTLQVGRECFKYRKALVCNNIDEMISILSIGDSKRLKNGCVQDKSRPIVFLFPGQGAQYVNMGLGLYKSEAVFRKQIDICANLLQSDLDIDIRDLLFPEKDKVLEAGEKLTRTCYTQPVLFAIEYALAKLWMGWGIQPGAMIGHSIGEYVAAVLSGVFTLEDGLSLVAVRGRIIQALPKGSMLAIPMSSDEVSSHLNEDISLAAINAPQLCVVSGNNAAIDGLEKRLSAQDIVCRRLYTSHAFHSPMMSPVLDAFQEKVSGVKLSAPQIPYISNLTGTWITENQAMNPEYWRNHLRHTVRFSDGVQELLKNDTRILLEVGPGNTLSTLVKHNIKKSDPLNLVTSMRHPKDKSNDEGIILNALGQIWLKGGKIDWQGFYKDEKRRRVILPTYPFERKRYWIKPETGIKWGLSKPDSLKKQKDIKDWFYLPSWKRTGLPLYSESHIGYSKCWLIFTDELGLGEQLRNYLTEKSENINVLVVQPGERFTKMTDHLFTVNTKSHNDINALFSHLVETNQVPEQIVHLWGLTNQYDQQNKDMSLEHYQERGFYSLFFIAQALEQNGILTSIRITVVSNFTQSVIGNENNHPEKITSLGVIRVLPFENKNITCRFIDTDIKGPDDLISHWVERLVAESRCKSEDILIAYRSNYRWVQVFEPVKLPAIKGAHPKFRKHGVYLITGGLGGIGLKIAHYLASHWKARLILISRSGLPPADARHEWLKEHGKDDIVSQKILKIQELEFIGAKVIVCEADVTDQVAMTRVLNIARENFGAINGVIHSAGIPGGGIIALQNRDRIEQVFAAKIKGTLLLQKMLSGEKLDFMVLCSSLVSLLTSPGQVDYTAANLFLDALAQYNYSTKGIPTYSINWDAWGEIGMRDKWNVSDSKQSMPGVAAESTDVILPTEGIEVFERVLGQDYPQIVVSTSDLQPRLDQWVNLKYLSVDDTSPSKNTPEMYKRTQDKNNYVTPRNDIERKLLDIWQITLGIGNISIHDNFFELGGDSIISLQIIAKVNQAGIRLTNQQIFEYQTIAELAAAVGSGHASGADQDNTHRQPPEQGPCTHSDFPGARLSKKDIDYFVNKISKSDGKLTK